MERYTKLKELHEDYCLKLSQNEIVPGYGNAGASMLLIGEAPGREEVKLSRPFVGSAGRKLDQLLEIGGINREDIYITNAIKYRLFKINPITGRMSNRPPTAAEIELSRKFIIDEIDIIRPEYIITLGNVPLRSVTGMGGLTIGTVHGDMMPIKLLDTEYKLVPLYHPASIIYNRSLQETYVDDLHKLNAILSKKS